MAVVADYMAGTPEESDTLVFEYQGMSDAADTAFSRILDTLDDADPTVTGFRLELTTAESFEMPFDALVAAQPQPDNTTDTKDNGDGPTNPQQNGDAATDTQESNGTPSLQSDGLPAQVLSRMLDRDDDEVRTRDLAQEFDDADIDTARISQTLASLKRRELVEAKPDPEDKRANIYWPTDHAERALSN